MNKVACSMAKRNTALAIACIVLGWPLWGAGSPGSAQTPPAGLSPGLREIIKLVQAQMNDDIILAYIKNSGFTLTANDIVYLTKEGIPQDVISELLKTSPPPAQPEPNPPPSVVPTPTLPPALQNIIRLTKAGVSDDIILAYIKNSGSTFTLTADDILYLKAQGLSEKVIAALLQAQPAGTTLAANSKINLSPQPPSIAEPPPLGSGRQSPTPANPSASNPSPSSASTWTQTSAPNGTWENIASSADGTKLVAVNHASIYTSSDSGATWKLTSAPSKNWFTIAASADGTKLVAGERDTGQIYRSSDGGATWIQTGGVPINHVSSIVCSGDGTRCVAVAGGPAEIGPIYVSSDSGATWTATSAPSEHWACAACSMDGTKLVAVVIDGPIYRSPDSGVTWTATGAPSKHWQNVASSADGTKLVACANNTEIYISSDSGATWRATGAAARAVASSADGTRLFGLCGDLKASFDSGATWTTITPNIDGGCNGNVTCSTDGTMVAASIYGGGIYSWHPYPTGNEVSTTQPVPSSPEPPAEPPPSPASPEMNFAYFQDQLAPYGTWVDVPGYGQCWQPSDLASGWRPYYDGGNWVYTDAGLYWQSDYPWGAVAFHYGRWSWVGGYGWIWVPGYEYAPAWVVWRHTDGYVGWAPLPAGAVWISGGWWEYRGARVAADYDFGLAVSFFVFVDYHHMWEHDYHPYVLHHEELHRVYRESAINRLGRDEHGRFVYEGLDREHLTRFTGRKVDVVRHEELQKRERVVLQNDHAGAVERLRSQSVAPRPGEVKLQQRASTATSFDGLAAGWGATGGVNPRYRPNAMAMKPQGTREQADNAQAGQKGSESALAMRKFLNAMKQSVPTKPEQNGDHNKPSENKDQQKPGGNQ